MPQLTGRVTQAGVEYRTRFVLEFAKGSAATELLFFSSGVEEDVVGFKSGFYIPVETLVV